MTDQRLTEEASLEAALKLVKNGAWQDLARLVADWHPADIADLIDEAPDENEVRIYSLVDAERRSDVLAELESETTSDILEALTSEEISAILEEMSPDDAADVLGEMPDERSEEVLALMEYEESSDVRKLLEYDEESAGGIMTTDVVSMTADQTVAEAIEAIAYMDTREKFYLAHIVDTAGKLTGYVNIWDLLRERNRRRPLGELVKRTPAEATVDMDQEAVAQLVHKYDMEVVPVVDEEGRLVGRITSDDVLDVVEEEASEDIFRLAGSDDIELETTSPLRSCMARLPWLLITLMGGFVVSIILKIFHEHLGDLIVLAVFVPVVLAMGGNAGIQSSTLIVRSLALGSVSSRKVLPLLSREIAVGAIMGAICGLVVGLWANLLIHYGYSATTLTSPQLALIVGLAMCAAMAFAAVFGALVPIILNKIRVDPAVASGPFVTITNDIAALLIYFVVTDVLRLAFT